MKNMFDLDVLENKDFTIVKSDIKSFYNTDGVLKASEWVRRAIKGKKTHDCPQMTSALKIKNKDGRGKISNDSVGYLLSNANSIQSNDTNVALFSTGIYKGNGFSIISDNFFQSLSLFVARRIISSTWINEKDEYLAPNESHQEYEQFSFDSIVYSLFNNSSEQSSLRQIEYKNKLWDIKNEFFWISVDKMKELSDEKGYDELYNDARTSPDRYVYKLLFGEERIYDKLSPDAKAVLDKATELVEKSMELRQVMANDENHLNSWDAGYAQLKLVWKEYFQEDFKEFRQLYKELENRMRPLVYELGFLLK
jgi:hypothetical protein